MGSDNPSDQGKSNRLPNKVTVWRHSKSCTICGHSPIKGRGWCHRHWRAWRLYGDPNAPLKPQRPMAETVALTVRDDRDACWPWAGSIAKNGYGQASRQSALAFMYEQFRGPIPAGMHVDHLCHTRDLSCTGGPECSHRGCANPWHGEIVTPAENARRGRRPKISFHRAKTHCPQGHPYDEENTRWYQGRRYCRACKRKGGRAKAA